MCAVAAAAACRDATQQPISMSSAWFRTGRQDSGSDARACGEVARLSAPGMPSAIFFSPTCMNAPANSNQTKAEEGVPQTQSPSITFALVLRETRLDPAECQG